MDIKDLIFTTGRGTVATDSFRVAQQTGRAHKNIRKSVKRLMREYGSHFYEVKEGNRLLFVMDREGFAQVTKTLPGIDEWRKAALRLFDGESVQDVAVQPRIAVPESPEQALAVREDGGVQYVSARLLHSFLQVATEFPAWFKYRCKQYDLSRGIDFEVLPIAGNLTLHNDYFLTLDTAKELCMVENNERGKLARRYFIEVEKRFRQMTRPVRTTAVPQTFAEALRLAACQAEQIESQRKQLVADAPKVAFADAITTSPTSCGIDELAKIISQNGVDIGEIRLFEWMRRNGYLCACGTARNQPTQKALDMKLFEIVPQTWRNPRTGETMTTTRTMVTGKGKQYFINRFIYNQERSRQ